MSRAVFIKQDALWWRWRAIIRPLRAAANRKSLGNPVDGDGLELIHSDLSQPIGGLLKSDIARLRATVQTVHSLRRKYQFLSPTGDGFTCSLH